MPVGTQGSLKGILPEQLESLDCKLMLGNTYHLGNRPGIKVLESVGGLHKFMNWNNGLLTDSGGYQMVSLVKMSKVSEEGVEFRSPHDDSLMLLTPEMSINIQSKIGADVIMQLDDVVSSLTTGPRVEEAMLRSIRWLDRCISAHKRKDQHLFGIIQGGLDLDLRRKCIKQMTQRNLPGYAIGGLSGGEEKDQFWRVVSLCTELLPANKPRYLMGVGYPLDIVVATALGVDMFDCVYPTRIARNGTALVPWGTINLKRQSLCYDKQPIYPDCCCYTCKHFTRAYLYTLLSMDEVSALSYISIHNVAYLLSLMQNARTAISNGKFPQFAETFVKTLFPDLDYPVWVVNALNSVGIIL
ncbi:hypothetical protein LOD99_14699 [Oopsacas minuta]|uniref:Queuine tRNA-ribosyltransferase catalytic subunit 1 n=1 Tax=Oopsacas minuta TaxID=111878 RepID=A0AAV7KCS9_9METZ|nr:hypothetical protein LOD99_14699 [Oopsacas minuta]